MTPPKTIIGRLAEIRARLNAATPGPWVWRDHYLEVAGSWDDPQRRWTVIADDGSASGEYSQAIDPHGPDAALIAHAPEDITYLLDLIPTPSDGPWSVRRWSDLNGWWVESKHRHVAMPDATTDEALAVRDALNHMTQP